MSVVTRTNRATTPTAASATTNYSWVAGTGGTASIAHRALTDTNDGISGYVRSTWTAATTAASGGVNYTQTGLSAATQYTLSLYVRASKAITVRAAAQFQTSSSTNVNLVNGTATALTANTWTRLSVTGTSGASVDRVVLKAEATSGLWANGDTLDVDMVLIETGATLQAYFDGAYVDGLGYIYAWTGTANASTSTGALYTPALALVVKYDAPTDRVEITLTDLPPTTNQVTIWRTADGRRRAVRSYRNVAVVGSDFVTDYEPPLNRLLTYELEVLSGEGMGGPSAVSTVTVTPTEIHGWIQDPLDPDSAIKVFAVAGPAGEPTLLPSAVAQLEYAADVSMMNVMGSDEPVALLGQRMQAGNVPFHFFTDAAQQATDLRNLLKQAPILLIRPGSDWGPSLPGACYVAPPVPVESPVGIIYGNAYTEWKFASSLVRAPSMNVVIPFWTYQDWQDLWTTYQQAQTALSGKTYLQVKKSPATGV
jgi:hypothetical protein